jgi:hypothetical protein
LLYIQLENSFFYQMMLYANLINSIFLRMHFLTDSNGYGLWCLTPLSTIFRLYRGRHGTSVLLVEETGVPEENHRPAASHRQTLPHNVVSSTPRHERGSNSRL